MIIFLCFFSSIVVCFYFYLFNFFKCVFRYSHGAIVQLSDLKEAIEPDFSTLKVGSRILMKMNPPEDEVKLRFSKYILTDNELLPACLDNY